jgi:putative flippase GtrA
MTSMSALDKLTRDAFRYGLVSVIALGVDAGLLNVLVKVFGWNYLVAATPAFLAGATVAYVLSVRFVFPVHKLRNRYLECVAFFTLGLVGVGVNAGALYIAVGAAGLGLTTAKLLAAGCTFVTNFTLRRQLLFSPPKAP